MSRSSSRPRNAPKYDLDSETSQAEESENDTTRNTNAKKIKESAKSSFNTDQPAKSKTPSLVSSKSKNDLEAGIEAEGNDFFSIDTLRFVTHQGIFGFKSVPIQSTRGLGFIWDCAHCNRQFDTGDELLDPKRGHFLEHHDSYLFREVTLNGATLHVMTSCDVCSRFVRTDKLKQHARLHKDYDLWEAAGSKQGGTGKCHQCRASFPTYADFDEHLIHHHEPDMKNRNHAFYPKRPSLQTSQSTQSSTIQSILSQPQ